MDKLVNKYNERKEADILRSDVLKEFSEEILSLVDALKKEQVAHKKMGIDPEEKSIYDILKSIKIKYDFKYPENKLIDLSKTLQSSLQVNYIHQVLLIGHHFHKTLRP